MDGQAEAVVPLGGWTSHPSRSSLVETIVAAFIAVLVAGAITSASLAVAGGPGFVAKLGAEGATAIVSALAARAEVSADRARLEQAARTSAALAAQGYPVAWNPPTGAWRAHSSSRKY